MLLAHLIAWWPQIQVTSCFIVTTRPSLRWKILSPFVLFTTSLLRLQVNHTACCRVCGWVWNWTSIFLSQPIVLVTLCSSESDSALLKPLNFHFSIFFLILCFHPQANFWLHAQFSVIFVLWGHSFWIFLWWSVTSKCSEQTSMKMKTAISNQIISFTIFISLIFSLSWWTFSTEESLCLAVIPLPQRWQPWW